MSAGAGGAGQGTIHSPTALKYPRLIAPYGPEWQSNGSWDVIVSDTHHAFSFRVGNGPTPQAAFRDGVRRMNAQATQLGYRRSPFTHA